MKKTILTLAVLFAATNVIAAAECDIKIFDKTNQYKVQSQTTIKAKGADMDAVIHWAEDRYKGLADKIEFNCVDSGTPMHMIVNEDSTLGWVPQFPVRFGGQKK